MKKKQAKKKIDENPETDKKKYEIQLKWILISIALILGLVILIYLAISGVNKFEYGGINFDKVKYGELQMYHSIIPIKDTSRNVVANYNLYLRNDPRTLSKININGDILLMKNTVVSVDEKAENGCNDSGIAGGNFFSFLKIAGIKAKVGYVNQTYAQEKNASYFSCNDASGQSVIILRSGEKNEINMISQDCYEIQFEGCDILKASERFMVGMIANSKGIIV